MKISEKQRENPSRYNTDKMSLNGMGNHSYARYYDGVFENYENLNISLLEIGIYNGASVRLFHDYFKNGRITGVDILNFWNHGDIKDYERLNVMYFDGYNIKNFNLFGGDKYDFIIDDGPHDISSQIFFLNNYVNLLKKNGRLILEDVPASNLDRIISECKLDTSKIKVFRYDIESKIYDDIIIEYVND